FESLEQHPRRWPLAMHQQRKFELIENRLEPLVRGVEHAIAGKQHKRPAGGHLQIMHNPLTSAIEKQRIVRLRKIALDVERGLFRIIKRRAKLEGFGFV